MALTVIAKSNPASEQAKMTTPAPSGAVHLALACCAIVLLVFCVVAAPRGALHVAIPLIETTLLVVPLLLIPAAYCHERKSWERRDSTLMLPWTLLIAALITQAAPTTVAHAFPLRDSLWRSMDEHLGIRIPDVMTFTAAHPHLQALLTFSYYWLLHPLLLSAIFLPPFMGKRVAAQRFILVNAIAFVVALPCMLFLPSVGPWVSWHFEPNRLQLACELTIQTLRTGVLSTGDSFGGIICFPSFHVFWAVVGAHALQPFRWLRYPAILVAGLITVSTMSTGWHYAVDVFSGILLAVLSTIIANAVLRQVDRSIPGSGKSFEEVAQ